MVPVTDDGHLLRMVTRGDIMKTIRAVQEPSAQQALSGSRTGLFCHTKGSASLFFLAREPPVWCIFWASLAD
jgi:hypothetical protein